MGLVAAGGLIVMAVCSHHLVSMSGLTLTPLYPGAADVLTFVDRVGIAISVCIVSSLLIATGVAALFFDRHLTDVKGLANANFEAVVLARAGYIVHVNERFAALMGRPAAKLRSLPLSNFLVERDGPQGVLQSSDGPLPVEIVEGVIEYRGRETSVFGLRDISERLEANRQLAHHASHDPLTGLLNRRAFDRQSEKAIAEATVGETDLSLLTLDLDRFKSINDVHGHAEGDQVLQQVAEVLHSSFGDPAILARIGGDEFSVLLPGHGTFEAQRCASVFMIQFKSVFGVHDKAGSLGVSIGLATFPDHGHGLTQLQGNADAALYRAKSHGKGRIFAFDGFLDQQLRTRRRLEEELRAATEAGQLFLLYQPIVEAMSGETKGYEALLRWRHPIYGVLSPAVFMEAAEQSGSIVEIGKWVLEEACRQAALWEDNVFLAVNVSARQLHSAELIDHVTAALEVSELAPHRLELEITETSLLEDRADVAGRLEALTALGVKLVIDDYGSGYSSMTNLRRYSFHKLKVDRSFVAALENDPLTEVIIDSAMALGKALGLKVVVEGVETEAQRARLVDKAPDQLQGFLFGRPGVMSGKWASPEDASSVVQSVPSRTVLKLR
jgi:diguanylate cyclase (GGDEF)-like protein